MDSGSTSQSPESLPPGPEEREEIVDLVEPDEPETLFGNLFHDGSMDIDGVRSDETPAKPEELSTTQTVARATSDGSTTASTFDEQLAKLPIVDIHCHIHGVSLSKTKEALKNFNQHGLFQGNDLNNDKKRKAFQKSLADYYQKSEETYSSSLSSALQLGHWNFKDDPWVAKKILRSTQVYQDSTDLQDVGNPVIITPMLLDFGYTPLGTSVASKAAKVKGSGTSMTETEARAEEAKDTGIFYFSKSARSEKHHRFFTRDTAMFAHQIEVLHLMAKLWPGQIMPFCPYDPRRPDGLDHVKKAMDTQAYVGVKLYARCGWMPYHNGAMHGPEVGKILDDRLDQLYSYVTQNDIPILNHTSPTGHPPDGSIVFPWRMTNEATAKDREEAELQMMSGITAYPPSHWIKPDRFVKGRTPKQKSLEFMRYELTTFGYYCLYDQLTTSPYAWEPVLGLYPKLRLCFAHFGSKLGVYANPRYNVNSQAADADCELLLCKNPMVAGATGARKFRDYFEKGAILFRNDAHAAESAASLLIRDGDWDKWLAKWATAYPDDWNTRITKLVTQYDNVYTDISFITGNSSSFKDIVGPLFQDALEQRGGAGRLFDKCMIGTDWYMTEMANLSPGDFWRLVEKACGMDHATYTKLGEAERIKRLKVWEHWATKNALRYLNVKPRLSGSGMDRLVKAYGCTMDRLPAWWKTLEKFYDNPEKVEPPK